MLSKSKLDDVSASEEESDGGDPSTSAKPATSKKRKLHDISGREVFVLKLVTHCFCICLVTHSFSNCHSLKYGGFAYISTIHVFFYVHQSCWHDSTHYNLSTYHSVQQWGVHILLKGITL